MSGGAGRRTAVLALLACSVFWGSSFSTIKICGDILNSGAAVGTNPAFGPLLVTALRFTVSLPLLLLFWKGARDCLPRRGDMGPLLRVSLPMSVAFMVQAAGLSWTTATLSAFLTNLTVFVTPGLERVLLGRRITRRLLAAVGLAVAGTMLMTLCRPAAAGSSVAGFGIGEILTLICAVAFAFQILWTGESAERLGPGRLTVGSFALLAAASWVAVLAAWPAQVPGALLAAVVDRRFLVWFAVMTVLATALAMVLMNVFQRRVRPTEAAVVYTTEPVIAGVFAWVLRGPKEALGLYGLIGAALMIVADLLAAIRTKKE